MMHDFKTERLAACVLLKLLFRKKMPKKNCLKNKKSSSASVTRLTDSIQLQQSRRDILLSSDF